MKKSTSFERFRDQMNAVVTEICRGYRPRTILDAKVIRDAVWGFTKYERHEINFIDSPFLQRLRGIFQTSLVLYTYPSSVHSRFEHSLGCVALIERMVESLNEKGKEISKRDRLEVRLAALLHDMGHGPLSHLSEDVYKEFSVFSELKDENRDLFWGNSASEILSYFLVVSDAFGQLWRNIKNLYEIQDKPYFRLLNQIDLKRVALMILGKGPEELSDFKGRAPKDAPHLITYIQNLPSKYLVQMVNGPFDVDKFDYLTRDGYFTGLKTSIDIERLLLTLDRTETEENGRRALCVGITGAMALEQLLFSRMLLFDAVYNHQKVRSAACIFKNLYQQIRSRGWKIKGLSLSNVLDFLKIDDYDILNTVHSLADSKSHQKPLDSVPYKHLITEIQNLKERVFYHRALVLTPKALVLTDLKKAVEALEALRDLPEQRGKLEKEIIEQARKMARRLNRQIQEVHLDFPTDPRFMLTTQASLVKIGEDKDGKPVTINLRDLYPAATWLTGYTRYRSKIYVFSHFEDRKIVAEAALRVFEKYGIRCNYLALQFAKHDRAVIEVFKQRGLVSDTL